MASAPATLLVAAPSPPTPLPSVNPAAALQGIHLIKHAAWRTLERGGQFVLLGSAPDARVQNEFNHLRDQLKVGGGNES